MTLIRKYEGSYFLSLRKLINEVKPPLSKKDKAWNLELIKLIIMGKARIADEKEALSAKIVESTREEGNNLYVASTSLKWAGEWISALEYLRCLVSTLFSYSNLSW